MSDSRLNVTLPKEIIHSISFVAEIGGEVNAGVTIMRIVGEHGLGLKVGAVRSDTHTLKFTASAPKV